jgi:hypothetical protein
LNVAVGAHTMPRAEHVFAYPNRIMLRVLQGAEM